MRRIWLGGAGGAPTNGVIRSLRESHRCDYLIGASSIHSDLLLADVDEYHCVPASTEPIYRAKMLDLLSRRRPHFLHVQNDFEVRAVSRMREEIEALEISLFLPDAEAVERCVDKFTCYRRLAECSVPVPETLLVDSESQLREAFARWESVWLRLREGGGGAGALPARNMDHALCWIDGRWGVFTAAERLSADSAAWLSIWYRGRLIVAQSRRRHGWVHGSRAPSGITGVTAVGETVSDPLLASIGQAACESVSQEPHGIFGVDFTYDAQGSPRVTEINIGRFFSTVYFFTRAGLNLPAIYVDLGLHGRLPTLGRVIDPLPPGLLWIRGMDHEPVMTTRSHAAVKTKVRKFLC